MDDIQISIVDATARIAARQVGLELIVAAALGGMYSKGQLAPEFLAVLRIVSAEHHKRAGDLDADEIAHLVDRMISVIAGGVKKPVRPSLTVVDGGRSETSLPNEEV